MRKAKAGSDYETAKHIIKELINLYNLCKEYGVSMALLVKRAQLANVITQALYTDYNIQASKAGWRKNEPTRIEREKPHLFEQLVYRAVNEQEISVQRGAELLKVPYNHVVEHCFFNEG